MIMALRLVRQMVVMMALVNVAMMVAGPNASASEGQPVRIVALGDSLTAGYGLQPNEAFPVQLERVLKAKGHNVAVSNAGVSGDTTAAGLARLDWAIGDGADIVIVELGANDALRGLSPGQARRNLDEILKRLKAKGITVLLAGMRAPRSLGEAYVSAFDVIYTDLAKSHGVALYPFFLDGVALDPKLNLADGLHPTAEGVGVIAAGIAPVVEKLLEARRVKPGQAASGG